jgi:hypothetical protein
VTDKLSVAKTYDVITMLGVLCIFDKYELVLANVLSWLKPNGVLILHNMISEADVDVFVKYSPSSSSFNEERLESGWNIISEKSLGLVCSANGSKLIKVKRFELSVDLMPKPQDPLRSWTELDTDGRKQIYNSLHLRQPQKVAVIRKLP